MTSSTTESSFSLRSESIVSSFSACGTVRGNPSSTKLCRRRQTCQGTRYDASARAGTGAAVDT